MGWVIVVILIHHHISGILPAKVGIREQQQYGLVAVLGGEGAERVLGGRQRVVTRPTELRVRMHRADYLSTEDIDTVI